MKRTILPLVILLATLVPGIAHADVGSNIASRLWDSILSAAETRLKSNAPTTVRLMQEAEKVFLGHTEDITVMTPIREIYKAMRVAGLLLLGLCTVISLSQLTEAGLMGESANLTDWIKRFGVASFMTIGSIHFYGLWIRVFNAMLDGFRGYLDTHWTGPIDPTAIYTQLIGNLNSANTTLILIFALVMLLVLLVLWFLIGGIRMAEMAIAVIIAPLVWPVYLIPALDDIPKTAFRSFLGLNATLLIIVGMLRLAVRMEVGGGIGNTVWNFVPAISLLIMTIFLPSMIKRLVGQGNTGSGGLMTAVYALAGLKGISMATGAAAKGAATAPPAQTSVPQAPAGPSPYPVATVPSSGSSGSNPGTAPSEPASGHWGTAPRQIHEGMKATWTALEAPYEPASPEEVVIDLGQSDPGSNRFDTVTAVEAWMNGRRRILRGPDPDPGDSRE